MQLQPFMPIGNAVILTTSGTASTNTSVMVPFVPSAGLNIPSAQPSQIRLINKGSADIWVSFTAAATAAVIPVAGTTTFGTPSPVSWLAPGLEITLTLPGIFQLAGATATGYGFWLNNISTGVSQQFYFQLGEGV